LAALFTPHNKDSFLAMGGFVFFKAPTRQFRIRDTRKSIFPLIKIVLDERKERGPVSWKKEEKTSASS